MSKTKKQKPIVETLQEFPVTIEPIAMSKTKTIWITRDDYTGAPYIIWAKKPKWTSSDIAEAPHWDGGPCFLPHYDLKSFEKMYSIKLKGGPRSIVKRTIGK